MIRPKNQGFTLLELLVVVLLLALALSLSYPSISRGSTTLHLHATGRDVLNTFRYARERSVTEQMGMMVTVDKEKQALILSNDFGEGSRSYSLPNDVEIQRVSLAGNEILEGPLVVRFLPNGSSDRAEVLLRSRTGSTLLVITDPITGGARIESNPRGDFR